MEYRLNFYGPLEELFGAHGTIQLQEGILFSELRNQLEGVFKGLDAYPYTLAQDGAMKSDEEELSTGVIEVFPPFSGG
ncbi:MAG: MoaD/ThiS family protein [Flavobacteriaceae bacterium]|jgi:molybdopterin converting factor small subunit